MRLGSEAVPPGERSLTGSGAQLRVLDRAAAEADEVMVVLGAAADIGRAPITGERMQRPGSPQEVEGPVDRGQTELG
jgi:hypothetical protein